jgi:hypothetical protein
MNGPGSYSCQWGTSRATTMLQSPPGEMPIASPLAGEGAKLVQLNFELFSIYLSNLTIYYISTYIYLYLKVINIFKSRKFPRDQCKIAALTRATQIG